MSMGSIEGTGAIRGYKVNTEAEGVDSNRVV
jgi:hypothetical protein